MARGIKAAVHSLYTVGDCRSHADRATATPHRLTWSQATPLAMSSTPLQSFIDLRV